MFHFCCLKLQVAQCYPDMVKTFPQQLKEILEKEMLSLNPDLRLV